MQTGKSGTTKRSRKALSSSESFEKEISDQLTNIETQLAKLDKLEVIKNLLAEISALKASVDFTDNQNAVCEQIKSSKKSE